jgi:hypothetical protein
LEPHWSKNKKATDIRGFSKNKSRGEEITQNPLFIRTAHPGSIHLPEYSWFCIYFLKPRLL